MYVQQRDTHNLLRPEFIESLWVMYQITGDVTYQDWGWRVFQVILYYFYRFIFILYNTSFANIFLLIFNIFV